MTKFLASAFILISLNATAQPKLTFMVEFADGQKHVALKESWNKDYSLLTTGKRWHLYPRLSSDGSQIVYSEGQDGQTLGLYTLDLKDGHVEQWTEEKGQNLHGRFSGNGKWLAFSGPIGPKNVPQIGLINIEQERKKGMVQTVWSEGRKKLIFNPNVVILKSQYPSFFPAFSSDGSFVVYQRNISEGVRDIVLQDIASGEIAQISSHSGNSMSPSLSFDDRFIAFTSKVNGNWDVYVYDRVKKEQYRVTNNVSQDFAPTFAPDGSVFFASDRGGHFQLYGAKNYIKGPGDVENVVNIVAGTQSFYAPSFSGEASFKQELWPSMISPARSSFGSVLVGSHLYVIGGHQGTEHTYPESSFTGRVDYFDVKGGAWHQGAPRPHPAHGFGLAANDRYIYAFGGFAFSKDYDPSWTSLDFIDRYDTIKNVWKTVGHLPHRRSSNVVAQVGSKVYLIGGWDSTPKFKGDLDGIFQNSIDVFDMDTEVTTTLKTTLPQPLRRAFTGVVVGDEVVLIGGIGEGASHFKLLSQVTSFNTVTGKWTELNPLPFGTFAPAAGVIKNSIYVFGGMLEVGKEQYTYINQIYSMGKNKRWINTGRYLNENKGFSQVVSLSDSKLAIMGGHNEEGEAGNNGPITSFEVFGF